jgi:hypothetical protein
VREQLDAAEAFERKTGAHRESSSHEEIDQRPLAQR